MTNLDTFPELMPTEIPCHQKQRSSFAVSSVLSTKTTSRFMVTIFARIIPSIGSNWYPQRMKMITAFVIKLLASKACF